MGGVRPTFLSFFGPTQCRALANRAGASVFLLYDSPLREWFHEGREIAGDNRSSGCNHPHRHLAQASWLVVATYPAPPKRSPFLRPQRLYTLSLCSHYLL